MQLIPPFIFCSGPPTPKPAIRNRRIIGSSISFEKEEMRQPGCLGIYSDGGVVGASSI